MTITLIFKFDFDPKQAPIKMPKKSLTRKVDPPIVNFPVNVGQSIPGKGSLGEVIIAASSVENSHFLL